MNWMYVKNLVLEYFLIIRDVKNLVSGEKSDTQIQFDRGISELTRDGESPTSSASSIACKQQISLNSIY